MRIEDGKEPLDRTSIHPESYKATKVLLKELGLDTLDLGTQKAKDVISDCDTNHLRVIQYRQKLQNQRHYEPFLLAYH